MKFERYRQIIKKFEYITILFVIYISFLYLKKWVLFYNYFNKKYLIIHLFYQIFVSVNFLVNYILSIKYNSFNYNNYLNDEYIIQNLKSENKFDIENKNYCKDCNLIKYPFIHHCSLCNKCIIRMDHHCPWLLGCIGINNYKNFLFLIFYANLASIYTLINICWYKLINKNYFLLDSLFIISIILSMSLSILFIFHLYIILNGWSTLDFIFYNNKNNRNFSENLKIIFGSVNILHILFPFKSIINNTEIKDLLILKYC